MDHDIKPGPKGRKEGKPTMSFISNLVHFAWATKNREPMIDKSWQDRLYGYLGGVLKNKNARLLCAGGMPDHIHAYVSLPATLSLADAANLMKTNTSKWVHETIEFDDFQWQEGYGAFTVSKSGEPHVMQYIRNQEEHHRKRTFKEEFTALLDKHGIEYDERYIWV